MDTRRLLGRLQGAGLTLEGHLLSRDGEPFAVLNPAVLFGEDGGDREYLQGPAGQVEVDGQEPESLLAALVACGGVLLGDASQALRLDGWLRAPRSSRTAAYLCGLGNDCAQVVAGLERIRDARVALWGCGGIGSLGAMLLAGAGVRHLRLVDGDRIEQSNLNRQLFWRRSDAGELKVDVLQRRIADSFPDVEVHRSAQRIEAGFLPAGLDSVDGVLCTVDEPLGAVGRLAAAARARGIPLVTAGYTLRRAVAGSVAGGGAPPEIRWHRGPDSIMPSFGPTNAELAGQATGLLLLILGGFHDGEAALGTWDTGDYPRRVEVT